MRGYTKTEQAFIKKAAKTGLVTDALNVFGSRLGAPIAGAAGFATMGPLGGAVSALASHAASSAARKGAQAIQTGKANAVADLIANGIPTVNVTNPLLPASTALTGNAVFNKRTKK